jgi:hypothetical protein
MHQLDVKTIFLNGYLDEKIYMNIPTPTNLALVCKLTKSFMDLSNHYVLSSSALSII